MHPRSSKTGLLLLLLCCTFLLHAQKYIRVCDSILKLPVHDSVKVLLLKKEAKATFETDVNANVYYMEQALPLAKKLGNYTHIQFFYNNLSNSYNDKGDFSRALEFNVKSLRLAEEKRDEQDVFNALMNMGNTYSDQEQDRLAKDCYHRAIDIAKKIGDEKELADVLGNYGLLFDNVKEKDSVLYYMYASFEVYKSQRDTEGMARTLNNLALVHMDNRQYHTAQEELFKARSFYRNMHDDLSCYLTCNNLGNLYYLKGDYKRSFAIYDSALTLYKDLGSQEDLLETYKGLSNVSLKLGNYKAAHAFLDRYVSLKDSTYSVENLSRFTDTKVGYEREVNEKEIRLLKEENELEDTRKRIYQALAVVALLFIIIVSWLFYTRYKIKQRSEADLRNKNREVEDANEELEVLYVQVTDSIRYAFRIQQAILPSSDDFRSAFNDHFIFYKPKDIVSGDFYWLLPIEEKGEKSMLLATVDCTGHGVPGGFMSMLGSSLLTEIANEKKIHDPADVLDLLRIKIISALKQKGTSGENQDGMDISLCRFDLLKMQLIFAGAHNAIYLVRGKELKELKPDKQPIGISHVPHQQFNQQTISLMEGDCIYAFTDGFADQFGGPKGKKFKYRQFEELLVANSHLPMEEQREKLDRAFSEWKGNLEQVDDVLVIGIRI
jgi:serine phosphatase RsbU (regulator of sigma subunit)